MKKRIIIGVMLISLFLTFGVWLYVLQSKNREEWVVPEQGKYETTLKVVSDIDYEPISFVDENGQPAGHDVALIYAIGEQLGVNIDLSLMEWNEAIAGFRSGEYDILLSVAYSPERTAWMEFTTPILNEPYMVFGKNVEDFNIAQLFGARIAMMEGDDVKDAIVTSYHLEGSIYYLPTYIPCFEMLANGECDYVVAPYTVGMGLVRQMDINDVSVCSNSLYNSIYCMAVQKGNTALVERINRELYILGEDGTLNELYENWMLDYTGANSLKSLMEQRWSELVIVSLLMLCGLCAVLLAFESRRSRELALQMEGRRQIDALQLKLDTVLSGISGGFMIYEDDGQDTIIYVSTAVAGLMGYTVEEFIMANHASAAEVVFDETLRERRREKLQSLGIDESYSLKYRVRCKDGGLKWLIEDGRVVTDEQGQRQYYSFCHDVTELEESRIKLNNLAYVDLLTNTRNKTAYVKTMEKLDARQKEDPDFSFGIVLFDLNDLKKVNDNLGHQMGDKFIKLAARCMQEAFCDSVIYRVGGDEFAALLFGPALEKLNDYVQAFEKRLWEYSSAHAEFPDGIGVAMGYAVYNGAEDTCCRETILRADKLMYADKEKKKTCINYD